MRQQAVRELLSQLLHTLCCPATNILVEPCACASRPVHAVRNAVLIATSGWSLPVVVGRRCSPHDQGRLQDVYCGALHACLQSSWLGPYMCCYDLRLAGLRCSLSFLWPVCPKTPSLALGNKCSHIVQPCTGHVRLPTDAGGFAYSFHAPQIA